MRRLLALITIAFLIAGCGQALKRPEEEDWGTLPEGLGAGVAIPGTNTPTFTLDNDNTSTPTDMAVIYNRGSESDVQLGWDETNDQLEANADFVAEKAFATSNIVTFDDEDATPSVASANVFKTANTASTTITMFDDGKTGQQIEVIIGDGYTTIDFTGTNLKGNDGSDWSPDQNDRLSGTFDGTYWWCDVGMTTSDAGGDPPGTSSATFTLDDDNIGSPTDMALVFNRGTSSDVQLGWDETNDQFEFDDDLVAEKAFATSNIVSFDANDTTPSVADANVFKTANTIATTITMFDDGKTGQDIKVVVLDDYTTIDFTGSNLKGNDSVDWSPGAGDILYATFDGTYWYCDIGLTTSDVGGGGTGDDIDLTKSDASGGPQTVDLPTAVGKDEDLYIVIKTDSSTNTVTIDPNGSETIDSADKIILRRKYDHWAGVSDNANWFTIALSTSFINVKTFGATGDGSTDDTSAIQAAISAAPNLATIYFPNGHYYLSGELDITKNLYILGEGWDSQIYQSSTTLNLFHVTATGQVVFENLRLGSSSTTAGTALIRLDNPCSHSIIRNISMQGGYYGIGIYGSLNLLIEHVCNTTNFWHSTSTNQCWIHGERYSSKSVNVLEINHAVLQGGTKGLELYDTNTEGSVTIIGGVYESFTTGPAIYLSGYSIGSSISGVHNEGGADSKIQFSSCKNVSLVGSFVQTPTVTNCVDITISNCFTYGTVTIDSACENINFNNSWYQGTLNIASGTTDISGLQHYTDTSLRGYGTFFPKAHPRSLCDGDLEAWTDNNHPLGFYGLGTAASVVKEASTVRFGSSSAKVLCDTGRTTAYIAFPLDTQKFDKDETFFPDVITVRFWAYKPSTDGYNPYILMRYAAGSNSKACATFSISADTWTPCQQTIQVAGAAGWTDPEVCIGGTGLSPGDYIYVDGITISEGSYAPPTFDDSRGTQTDFRVGGTFLQSGAVGTMTGNETFTVGDGNVFVKDPGGANRNFNPSGSFPPLVQITVVNTADASETIYFNSTGLNESVGQGQRAIFVYNGTAWLKVYKGS